MGDSSTRPLVLLFVEDPGAFAYLAGLEDALVEAGLDAVTIAAGHARDALPDAIDGTDLDADGAIAHFSPAAVVIGTCENLDTAAFDLVHTARARNIPTFGAVDSAANAPFRFRGRSSQALAHAPDFLLVPDVTSREAFVALGFSARDITVTGHPRLAELSGGRNRMSADQRSAAKRRLFPNAGDRPVVVFVSELSTGLGDDPFRRTLDWTLHGTGDSDRRTDVVAQELLQAARALPTKPWMVLRLHPKQSLADVAGIVTGFDQVSRNEPGMEVVAAADLVTGMTSILLAEAAMSGCRVLSIVPDPAERLWLGDIGELITCVSARQALEQALADWPEPLQSIQEDSRPDIVMVQAILSATGV